MGAAGGGALGGEMGTRQVVEEFGKMGAVMEVEGNAVVGEHSG